jgi:hypothetical protein
MVDLSRLGDEAFGDEEERERLLAIAEEIDGLDEDFSIFVGEFLENVLPILRRPGGRISEKHKEVLEKIRSRYLA